MAAEVIQGWDCCPSAQLRLSGSQGTVVSDQPGILLKKSISGEQSMPGPCTVDSSCRSLARTHFAGLRTKAGELYIDDTA